MKAESITSKTTLFALLTAIDDFCRQYTIKPDDEECMRLREQTMESDNDLLRLLSAYLTVCDTGEEVIEALYEFLANCQGFAEANPETTQQITKNEFEAILDECEDKCGFQSCIEQEHHLIVAEADAVSNQRIFNQRFVGDIITLFLPRIERDTNAEQYIAEELGLMLYEVLVKKIPQPYLKRELRRYIPEARTQSVSTRQLFRKYFCDVVRYKEQPPGIHPKFTEQTQQVIAVRFFKDIIQHYLRE